MIKETFYDVASASWPTIVIFLSIVIILRGAYLSGNKREFVFYKEIILLIFITYVLLLFELLTSKDINTLARANFIPFREIFRYEFGSKRFLQQVLGNIVIFIPFGYFAAYYIKSRKSSKVIIPIILSSAVIETVQYYIGRSFDIDDIILNTIGGTIGYLLYVILNKLRDILPRIFKKEGFYNVITFAILVLVILYALDFFGIWSFKWM